MNRRLLTILLIAFAIALGCSFIVYRMVGNRLMAVAQPHGANVIVAANDVKIGSILQATDLTTTQMVGPLPKGAIVKKEDAIGRGVVSALYQGEPVIDSRLAAPGSGGGLAATIQQGMRACAVKVDEVVGVAGFVTPGMRVDVLISGSPVANTNDGPKTKTLLQNIQVLSAGQDIQKDNEGKPQSVQVVNLLVTPEQAELLSLASNQTRIQLVLRNPLDTQEAHPPGVAMASLFTDTAPAPKARPAGAPHKASNVYVIEVLNGAKRSEQKFGAGEEKQ